MHSKKSFTDFEEGIDEIVKVVPQLNQFFGITDSIIFREPKELVRHLLEIVSKDVPSIDDIEYPRLYSISVSANQVGFRTKSNIAFGWHVVFDKDTGDVTYTFRISIYGSSFQLKTIENSLKENGWEQTPLKTNYKESN